MREGHAATMLRSPSRQIRRRLQDALPERDCGMEDWQLTYQKCRFCDRSWPELKSLFKFAVRHWICADCIEAIRQLPPESYAPRKGV